MLILILHNMVKGNKFKNICNHTVIDETGNCTIVSGQLRYILIVLPDWLTARKLMLSWNVVNFAHAIYEHRAMKTV